MFRDNTGWPAVSRFGFPSSVNGYRAKGRRLTIARTKPMKPEGTKTKGFRGRESHVELGLV